MKRHRYVPNTLTTVTLLFGYGCASAAHVNAAEPSAADAPPVGSRLRGSRPVEPATSEPNAPESKAPEPTDDALLRALLGENTEATRSNLSTLPKADGVSAKPAGEEPATAVAQGLERLHKQLQTARQGLDNRQTGAETQAAQRAAIQELDQLIATAKSAAADGSNSEGDSSGSPQPEAQPGEPVSTPAVGNSQAIPSAGNGSASGKPQANRDGKAEDSSERQRDRHGNATATLPALHADLIRESWGHLPPRLRDQLLNAGGDRTVPQYDPLVRRYFESLAAPTTGD